MTLGAESKVVERAAGWGGLTARRRLLSALTVFLVTVVAFLVLEGGYRLYKLVEYGMVDYPDVVTVGLFQRDPLYGWIPARNFHSERDIPEKIRKNDRVAGPHFHKQITFNSLGYRGPEFSIRKAPDVYRIVMLGESTTLNLEVDDTDTLTALLERKLQGHDAFKARHGVSRVEVINAGVSRWRTREGLLRLQQEVRLFSPDLILVAFNWNDAGEWAVHRYDPDRPIPDETPWWAAIKILHNLRVRYLIQKFDEAEHRSWAEELHRSRYWASAYERNILAMQQIASEINAELMLVNLPGLCRKNAPREEYAMIVGGPVGGEASFSWYAGLKELISGLMANLAHDHGMRTIDVAAYFDAVSGKQRLALFGDAIHYTEAGSEAVARAIFLALTDEQGMPGPAGPSDGQRAVRPQAVARMSAGPIGHGAAQSVGGGPL